MVFLFRIGLKLYSTDVALIQDAVRFKEGLFNFVELYIVPGSYVKTISAWKNFDIPYVIHAPHSFHGVNLAQADRWEIDHQHLNETRLFADDLFSDIIIVHGESNGSFREAIRQIRLLGDQRIVLENKPKLSLFNEECVGWTPSEFRLALETGAISGMVLDFVHESLKECFDSKQISKHGIHLSTFFFTKYG